jgi:hypothetical protein
VGRSDQVERLHGHQEGRFFHGYYDNYCYLPLYVFCGRHLLVSKLRPADIDASAGSAEEVARVVARIRQRWPALFSHQAISGSRAKPESACGRLPVRPGAQ